MGQQRALKVVLVLLGVLFLAGIYPITISLLHPGPSQDPGDTMMLSLYFALGIFLLIAARNPAENRGVIAFTAWSSFAHALVMTIQGIQYPSERQGFLAGSGILVAVGVLLLALLPAKAARVSPVSAAGAVGENTGAPRLQPS
ncbi:MAG: DUF6632 domain-containing protein [Terriglobia bacterium]